MNQRLIGLICIIGVVGFVNISYAGLEETNRWYELRAVQGTWTVAEGVLKVSDPNNTTFYVLTNLPNLTTDNYTLKLKARIDSVNNPDENGIIIYFCGYKLIIKGEGTKTALYKPLDKAYIGKEWKLLWIDFMSKIDLETSRWYEIEILKYKGDIEIKFGTQTIQIYDDDYGSCWDIAVGAYNSEVWFDDVEILPSLTGRVKDRYGILIPDVKIIVLKDSSVVATTTTKSDGTYQIYGLEAGVNYDIKISKFGYKEAILEDRQIDPTTNPTINFSPSLEPPVSLNDVICYPNPAKGIEKVTFLYNLDIPGKVKIKIYNIIGELIDELEDDKLQGVQTTSWNISRIASGIYICCIESRGSKFKPKKLGIMK